MTKELIKDYTLRITQANASEIVVIVYDITEQYIKDALSSYDKGDYEEFETNCRNACRCVDDLLQALDFSYELAYPLMRLYIFVNREISVASVSRKTEGLLNARGILISLRDAFAEAAKKDSSAPVMTNTQAVYAGLTYGRNQLNESINDTLNNRGYTV